MSDPHQDSEGETQYRANVLDLPDEKKKKHAAKYKKDNKLWLTRTSGGGSIQVIVQDKRTTEKPNTGGWEYEVKDPDTGVCWSEWFAQNLLTRMTDESQ